MLGPKGKMYQTFTYSLENNQTPVDFPRCEAGRYVVKTIAVNLKTLAAV